MAQPQQELRTAKRFQLKLPVSIHLPEVGWRIETYTQNVSARGMFFLAQPRLAVGSNIEVTLTLPPQITLTESLRVRCRARVVRVEHDSVGRQVGAAALIEQYEFVES
jgi:hypothetical protein